MITGLHAIVFTPQVEADRVFFRDVLELPSVDAGGGWLIFKMPPAELACHPIEPGAPALGSHQLYLMCEDVHATVAALTARGVHTEPITDQRWGLLTALTTPGGVNLGLYQPKHPTAISLSEPR